LPVYLGHASLIAALAAVGRELVNAASMPVGVNVLRNDGESAVAIATAIEAQFIRVNVHMNAVVSEQGIIQGLSHLTVRLRSNLRSDVSIFADVGVKHAAPLADRGLATETKDLTERGLVDAIIVSGDLTGAETSADDVDIAKQNTNVPVLIGSGTTPDNISKVFDRADGFIVGSYFKTDGVGNNLVDSERVAAFCKKLQGLRG
jgi:membrane complex biogenesis BtpA family protein